jgi:hypothetical protein
MSDVNWYDDNKKSRHHPIPDRTRFKGSPKEGGKNVKNNGRITKANKRKMETPNAPGLLVMGGDDDDSLQSLYEC